MGPDQIHGCPRCELRFATTSEWRDHVEHAHEPARTVPREPAGRLVIAVDPRRPSGGEVAVGAALAAQMGQMVDLVAVPAGGVDRLSTDAYLRARVHEVRPAGVATVAWSVLEGPDPTEALLEHLEPDGTTMVCLGTRARSAVGELLLGSVSQAVLRGSRVPVVLAGPSARPPEGRYERAVACVDGSEVSGSVLALADRIAERARVPSCPFLAVADWWDESGLDPLATPPTLGGSSAAAAILEALHDDPATIAVVGTEGRRGFSRLLYESVAVEVTRRACGPVVILPPGVGPPAVRPVSLATGA